MTENWLFTILLSGILITSLPFLRDIIFHEMGIYGEQIFPTPEIFSFIHLIFGYLLVIVCLIHVAIHSRDKEKDLMMKDAKKDFKAFLHSLIYLIKFSKREEPGSLNKYSSRQRVIYLGLVYNIGLSAISGVSLIFLSSNNSLITIFKLTHILAAIIVILILLIHLAFNIRHHDLVAFRCSFNTGKMPLWYIKKHHRKWYLKILNHERKLIENEMKIIKVKSMDPVIKALTKFFANEGIILSSDEVEKLAVVFKRTNDPSEIKKLIDVQ